MKVEDCQSSYPHDDVIKWKHFPRNWPFVRGIHQSPVNSPHKGQWRRALMFSLICVWINDWVNNREAGDLRRYRAHYDVIVMDTISYRFTDLSKEYFDTIIAATVSRQRSTLITGILTTNCQTTVELPIIWNTTTSMWRYCNDNQIYALGPVIIDD